MQGKVPICLDTPNLLKKNLKDYREVIGGKDGGVRCFTSALLHCVFVSKSDSVKNAKNIKK